jgi:nucleoside-diphosphate-sugar epimerase
MTKMKPSSYAPATGERSERALVTGCAGFLGSHLSDRLLEAGASVVGVDSFTDYYPRALKERNLAEARDHRLFELHERDVATDRLDDLLEGVDVIFHLAAQAGVRGSFGSGFDTYLHANVKATQRLLEAAVRAPVERIVYASSSSIYGNATSFPTGETAPRAPVSPYGTTKCATEDLAGVYHRNHDIRTVGMRYFTAYGPRQRPDMAFNRFIAAGLAGEPITILGDGLQVRDFTFVDDVIEATLSAAENGMDGSVYNVGGGTPVTLLAAVQIIEEQIGHRIEVRHHESARGDARQTSADTRRARADLGFGASVQLEDGLARQLAWMAALDPVPLKIAS